MPQKIKVQGTCPWCPGWISAVSVDGVEMLIHGPLACDRFLSLTPAAHVARMPPRAGSLAAEVRRALEARC